MAIDRGEPVSLRMLAIAALGMGAPVAAGLMLGQAEAGFTIGLGAILLAGAPTGASGSAASPPPGLAQTVSPALIAVAAATAIAGLPWSDTALVLLAAAAGLLSGYSRPIAGGAIRFIIYFVLSVGFLDGAQAHRGAAALIFGSGALWNIALRGILAGSRGRQECAPQKARQAPTGAQRRAHFRRTLYTLEGWQYPLRLALGLGIASGLRHLWPSHHFYWILLTVALLTQRPIEHVPVKTVQRLIGTLGGVVLTGAILFCLSSPIALGIVACVLATVVPLARARNYLLYAIVSTPLILLVLDIGRPVAPALLFDRLVATLAAGLTVMALNVLFDRLLTASAGGEADRRRGVL
ncbi:FUSC family protein [Sphingomonas sp. RB3P16]|uniref:FUSC family protein n=1 Tax=Parasphingomonas frigoris TaxID=3096163 RepID=UPI002FCA58BA